MLNESLCEHFGVELGSYGSHDFLSDGVASEFRDAIRTRHLVSIEVDDLEPEVQIVIAGLLGPVADEYATGKRYSVMSNRAVGGFGRTTELIWHSDFASTRYPHDYLSLYGVEIGGTVTMTRFIPTNRVESIPHALAARIQGKDGIHAARLNGATDLDFSNEWDLISKKLAGDDVALVVTRKPIVNRDPMTGLHYIDVNPMMTGGVFGYSFEEGTQLLAELYEFLYDESQVLEYEWKTGRFALWNNRLLQHCRGPVSNEGPIRTIRRVAVNSQLSDLHAAIPGMLVGVMPFTIPSTDAPEGPI